MDNASIDLTKNYCKKLNKKFIANLKSRIRKRRKNGYKHTHTHILHNL